MLFEFGSVKTKNYLEKLQYVWILIVHVGCDILGRKEKIKSLDQ